MTRRPRLGWGVENKFLVPRTSLFHSLGLSEDVVMYELLSMQLKCGTSGSKHQPTGVSHGLCEIYCHDWQDIEGQGSDSNCVFHLLDHTSAFTSCPFLLLVAKHSALASYSIGRK